MRTHEWGHEARCHARTKSLALSRRRLAYLRVGGQGLTADSQTRQMAQVEVQSTGPGSLERGLVHKYVGGRSIVVAQAV